ncbi:MAG: hypothetical protein NTZ04_04280 [Chloroflexi bacterium]|nr:hypothetical protein [Chloroflexota bacterium]
MATEEWTVHAKLTGEFYISDERHSSKAPLVEGLRQLTLSPGFNDDGKWTGLHELNAVLSLQNKGCTPLESHVVYERSKGLVDNVTALATLGIGRPVRVSGGVSVKRRITDKPPKYRFITRATDTTTTAPPAPLTAELLAMSIDARVQRVIRWWAHGLATSDAVDQLVALNNALDLLAGMQEGALGRVRQCKSCGVEEAIGPGLRERVIYFLTDLLGYTQAVATDVYESRLDLAHARTNLEECDLRRYRGLATLVAAAVRTGIARALAITLPPIPEPLPFDLPSALLDIEYVEREMAQGSPNEPE